MFARITSSVTLCALSPSMQKWLRDDNFIENSIERGAGANEPGASFIEKQHRAPRPLHACDAPWGGGASCVNPADGVRNAEDAAKSGKSVRFASRTGITSA
jgi:hypothetical protein